MSSDTGGTGHESPPLVDPHRVRSQEDCAEGWCSCLKGEFGDPTESLASASGPHRDTRGSTKFRTMKHIGFRCVVSERSEAR